MNQRAAFDTTVALAEERGMPELPGSSLGLAHLRDMQGRITDEFSQGKLGRWLGWAQAALVMADVGVGLEDVKQINLSHSPLGVSETDVKQMLKRHYTTEVFDALKILSEGWPMSVQADLDQFMHMYEETL